MKNNIFEITYEKKIRVDYNALIKFIKLNGFEFVDYDPRDYHYDMYENEKLSGNKNLKTYLYVPNLERFDKHETIEFYIKYCIDQLANMLNIDKNDLVVKLAFETF